MFGLRNLWRCFTGNTASNFDNAPAARAPVRVGLSEVVRVFRPLIKIEEADPLSNPTVKAVHQTMQLIDKHCGDPSHYRVVAFKASLSALAQHLDETLRAGEQTVVIPADTMDKLAATKGIIGDVVRGIHEQIYGENIIIPDGSGYPVNYSMPDDPDIDINDAFIWKNNSVAASMAEIFEQDRVRMATLDDNLALFVMRYAPSANPSPLSGKREGVPSPVVQRTGGWQP
jgi:hypothetical protein